MQDINLHKRITGIFLSVLLASFLVKKDSWKWLKFHELLTENW